MLGIVNCTSVRRITMISYLPPIYPAVIPRNIPKNICQLSNNGELIETDSTKLNKRPHERLEMLV